MSATKYFTFYSTVATLATLTCITIVACSGSGSSSAPAPTMGTASVMVSDPATCSGPTRPYAHVFVTITDVQANVSSSAGNGDSGWTDLTPGLSSQPKQIDLLGQANNQCFLATLGDPPATAGGRLPANSHHPGRQ